MVGARPMGRVLLLLAGAALATACSTGIRGGPGPRPAGGAAAAPPTTVSLEGSFLWLQDDLSLGTPGGGRIHLSREGEELAVVEVGPDGHFWIVAELPPGRVTLRFVQLGFDIQERTLLVRGDVSARLAPVCTAVAFGPPGEPIPLPALALLDEPTGPHCDYPLEDTVRPYDIQIRRDAGAGGAFLHRTVP